MRLTRLHVDVPLAVGTCLRLPEAAAAHLVRVLRAGVGDACVLLNGDGRDYDARILVADKLAVEVEVLGSRQAGTESPLRIVLVQALARGEKMDWIVQKATELGVAAIMPVVSERSEVKLAGERADKRLAHWRNVAVSACEQSGRSRVPDVTPPQPLAAAVLQLPADAIRLTLDPEAANSIHSLRPPREHAVVVAIGPEGGWSPRDRAQLHGAHFTGLRLGPRILRTETAGIAAVTLLQARYGDLS